ncbi:GNAT family N-acetyltransferase [Bacillus sp. 179-C3.3 HS]|uniref:GNAT family N-acetyltransferase n=1 Tax=Bacillus sp. 179-C3.3 HS TaxID=3232162 RepID=UPI0039A17BBA
MIVPLDHTNREQAKRILQIQLAAYEREAVQIGYRDLPPLKETINDIIEAIGYFVGFKEKGKLLGIVSYEMDGERIVISRLAVHPDHLYQGIGTQLMRFMISHGKPIELTTAEANLPAIKLYEKLGFKKVARLEVENNLILTKMERAQRRRVEVVEYKTSWHDQFRQEHDVLKTVLGENWVSGHHIGSTSIAGMAAKPIIDILLEVKQIKVIDQCNHLFEQLGYTALGENGITGRRFLTKGGLERSHHIHVYEAGHHDIRRHLPFRDFLKATPHRANDYAAKKRQLAKAHPEDIASYIRGKDALIKEIEKEAYQWSKSRK